MKDFINHLTERNFQSRRVGIIENGSWAPMAAKTIRQMLEKSKDLTFTETTVTIKSALNEESRAQLDALAKELCAE
jgi:flavorubredoxin